MKRELINEKPELLPNNNRKVPTNILTALEVMDLTIKTKNRRVTINVEFDKPSYQYNRYEPLIDRQVWMTGLSGRTSLAKNSGFFYFTLKVELETESFI